MPVIAASAWCARGKDETSETHFEARVVAAVAGKGGASIEVSRRQEEQRVRAYVTLGYRVLLDCHAGAIDVHVPFLPLESSTLAIGYVRAHLGVTICVFGADGILEGAREME